MTPAAHAPGCSSSSLLQFAAAFLTSWNWKCALMSATVRSAVYLSVLLRGRLRESLAVVLVEMVYVSLTAGLYAGWQQRALLFRNRWLGNLIVVVGVPGLSQLLDWMAHCAVGAPAPHRALLVVCCFSAISALFHLYVMRRGAFLTGGSSGSLLHDFRILPRLLAGLVLIPMAIATAWLERFSVFAQME